MFDKIRQMHVTHNRILRSIREHQDVIDHVKRTGAWATPAMLDSATRAIEAMDELRQQQVALDEVNHTAGQAEGQIVKSTDPTTITACFLRYIGVGGMNRPTWIGDDLQAALFRLPSFPAWHEGFMKGATDEL